MFLFNNSNFTKIKTLNHSVYYFKCYASHSQFSHNFNNICLLSTTYSKPRRFFGIEFNYNQVRKCGRLTGAKKEKQPKSLVNTLWKVWGNNSSKITYYYDQVSLARVVGSLYLELPKTLPSIKDGFHTFFTKFQFIKDNVKPKVEFKSDQNIKSKNEKNVGNLSKTELNVQIKNSSQVNPISEKKDHLIKEFVKHSKPKLPENLIEAVSSAKKSEGVLSTASDVVFATFKNFSHLLPSSMNATLVQVKEPISPSISTIVDSSTGQTKMSISWVESKQEAIERRVKDLLEHYRSDEKILLELCKYLVNFPSSASVAAKDPELVSALLKARGKGGYEMELASKKALRIIGYADPLQSKGIRLLSLDGGGTRGLITLSILKELERMTGRPIYELFDYVCGVSTGSLIGVMAFLLKLPLHQAESVYRHFSKKMFSRNRLIGASKLVMTHAYYDTSLWEEILRRNVGPSSFIESMSDCSHLSVVSTLMNAPRVQNFVFRNYNLPPNRRSRYQGSVEHRLWEAVRASSAAPGYFEEFELDGHVHQDGGVLTNNPTAIAIHEAKIIWPREPIQCIVSVGTGWYEASNEARQENVKSSLRSKITKVIESATDTEGIHMVLKDFLPPPKYFRFNPSLSGVFELDETRDILWRQMEQDTLVYCRRNRAKLEAAAGQLVRSKSRVEVGKRWVEDNVKPPFF